jgi:lipopolysaccharide transport system ATP-binding protein
MSQEHGPYREFGDERGRYHHAPFALRISPGLNGLDDLEIEIEHRASPLDVVRVEVSLGGDYYAAGELSHGMNGATQVDRFRLPEAIRHKATQEQSSDTGTASHISGDDEDIFRADHVVEGDSYSTGEARISAVRFLSPDIEGGKDRRVFICGEPLEMEMLWQAEQTIEDCRLALAVYRSDGRCATQIVSPPFARAAGEHKDRLILSPLRLGPMEYVASVGIFRGLRDEHRHGLDPLHIIDRRFVLKVMKRPNHEIETGEFLHDATWIRA